MSAGPLRQVVAVAGLLGLVPILLQLAAGSITPEDAALRGLALVAAVLAVGYVARMTLASLLRRMERRSDHEADGVGAEPQHGEG